VYPPLDPRGESVAVKAEQVIGRSDELTAVHSFVATGGPAALLIEGEAGIGKTTVWRAGVAEARRLGACVLKCAAAQAETELAYAG
jgi:MoxR-like ATPase